MDRLLVFRDDGLELAFERSKAWSKYCKDLLQYVSSRVSLELEHQKRVQKLAEQTKQAINQVLGDEQQLEAVCVQHFLPLKDVFVESCENETRFCEETNEVCRRVNERFVKVTILNSLYNLFIVKQHLDTRSAQAGS